MFLTDNSHRPDVPIVIDTGASFSLTPFINNFTSKLEPSDIKEMHGLSDSVMVKGVGWVEWLTKDANGQVAVIKTRSYYVPDADI